MVSMNDQYNHQSHTHLQRSLQTICQANIRQTVHCSNMHAHKTKLTSQYLSFFFASNSVQYNSRSGYIFWRPCALVKDEVMKHVLCILHPFLDIMLCYNLLLVQDRKYYKMKMWIRSQSHTHFTYTRMRIVQLQWGWVEINRNASCLQRKFELPWRSCHDACINSLMHHILLTWLLMND